MLIVVSESVRVSRKKRSMLLQFTSCSGFWWSLLFYTQRSHFITLGRLSHLRRFRTQSVINRVPPCRNYRQWELAYTAHSLSVQKQLWSTLSECIKQWHRQKLVEKRKEEMSGKKTFAFLTSPLVHWHALSDQKEKSEDRIRARSEFVRNSFEGCYPCNHMPVLISTTRLSLIFLP